MEWNNVHIPAAMLKSFLRQLPEPLLTYELYDHIVRVQCMYTCSIGPVHQLILCSFGV